MPTWDSATVDETLNYDWTGWHVFDHIGMTSATATALTADSVTIDGFTAYGGITVFNVSDNLKISSDTATTTTNNPYLKMKQFTVRRDGNVRVKFDLRSVNNDATAYGRIYVNETGRGTARSSSSNVATTYSEDISVMAGDRVQLYATVGASAISEVSNFRLYFDEVASSTVVIEDSI